VRAAGRQLPADGDVFRLAGPEWGVTIIFRPLGKWWWWIEGIDLA
jgi:hypothetical protein